MDKLTDLFNKISIEDKDIKLINETVKQNSYDDNDIEMLVDGIKIMSIENNSKKRKQNIDSIYVELILRIINECRRKKSTMPVNDFSPKWIDSF